MESYFETIVNTINAQTSQIEELTKIINEQNVLINDNNKKINKLSSTVRDLNLKIEQKSQRDINKAIRQFAMKNNHSPPINFVATKTPLSQILSE